MRPRPKKDSRAALLDADTYERLAEALPQGLGPAGLKYSQGMFRDRETAADHLTVYGATILDALAPVIAGVATPLFLPGRAEVVRTVLDTLTRHQWSVWSCTCGTVDPESRTTEDEHLAAVIADLFATLTVAMRVDA